MRRNGLRIRKSEGNLTWPMGSVIGTPSVILSGVLFDHSAYYIRLEYINPSPYQVSGRSPRILTRYEYPNDLSRVYFNRRALR